MSTTPEKTPTLASIEPEGVSWSPEADVKIKEVTPAEPVSTLPPKLEQSRTATPIPQQLTTSSVDTSSSSQPRKKIKLPSDLSTVEVVGGSSVRKWLNANLTPHLLEGMRRCGEEQPEEPLKFLGEFLLQKHEELKAKTE
ncbi:hypothetical protein BABINDRAFT_162885 [Babjeviella inositovora NRRL Y-12698]|uniref:Uncharacterized protein n=1 Tax=Babjeviella inositovora NRRL Y-12698 TaxID=984486 RepID=A0A1E3QKN9_9ASCO|nr:uncharacterized protein BABINDRAFT_162885 [Babjeviella inositovora NRRL Y-12698]ODQ78220.1 hypothetical protein BABINDRAFT_162885 [Babjeviella inositovora NRRL Y-12698]